MEFTSREGFGVGDRHKPEVMGSAVINNSKAGKVAWMAEGGCPLPSNQGGLLVKVPHTTHLQKALFPA